MLETFALDAPARKIALDAHARIDALERITRRLRSKSMLERLRLDPMLELVHSKVARTAAVGLQSAGVHFGSSQSIRAAMRHVTMPCTRRTASRVYKWKINLPSPVTAAVLPLN